MRYKSNDGFNHINKVNAKSFREIIHLYLRYIELDEHDRKLLDRFLRNYGRYESAGFEVRVKGPEAVRSLAREYGLNVQPLFLVYWCEDDGRIRKQLQGVLNQMPCLKGNIMRFWDFNRIWTDVCSCSENFIVNTLT